jgi:ribosomal protein S18 acetylase RimI-like enzyme
MRFMAESSEAMLDRVAEHAAPDLMLEIERDGAVRGVLEAFDLGHGDAEIALSVEDAYQGLGLGRRLFEEGLRHLGRRGYTTADLYCLRENTPVLRLVKSAGGEITFQGSEARAEIDLSRVLSGTDQSL